jgi:hypothetical protein
MDEHLPERPTIEMEPEAPQLRGARREVTQVLISLTIVLILLIIGTFIWAATTSSSGESNENAGLVNPQIGESHWHAPYAVYFGLERQENSPTWESGVHTHGDGIIHIHPFTSAEEGSGAALTKFFEYGGGVLTEDEIRIPGFSATLRNGDQVPGETESGQVYIAARSAAESEQLEDLGNGWFRVSPEYIPRDGDQIMIFFSTEAEMRHVLDGASGVPTLTPVPSPSATQIF